MSTNFRSQTKSEAKEWEDFYTLEDVSTNDELPKDLIVFRAVKKSDLVKNGKRVRKQIFVLTPKPFGAEKSISVHEDSEDWPMEWNTIKQMAVPPVEYNCYVSIRVGKVRDIEIDLGDNQLDLENIDLSMKDSWEDEPETLIPIQFNVLPSHTIDMPHHCSIYMWTPDKIVDSSDFKDVMKELFESYKFGIQDELAKCVEKVFDIDMKEIEGAVCN